MAQNFLSVALKTAKDHTSILENRAALQVPGRHLAKPTHPMRNSFDTKAAGSTYPEARLGRLEG